MNELPQVQHLASIMLQSSHGKQWWETEMIKIIMTMCNNLLILQSNPSAHTNSHWLQQSVRIYKLDVNYYLQIFNNL